MLTRWQLKVGIILQPLAAHLREFQHENGPPNGMPFRSSVRKATHPTHVGNIDYSVALPKRPTWYPRQTGVEIYGLPMKNPWLAKNPWMSIWLSGAHRASAPVRRQLMAEGRRQTDAIRTETVRQIVEFWTPKLPAAQTKRARRKR